MNQIALLITSFIKHNFDTVVIQAGMPGVGNANGKNISLAALEYITKVTAVPEEEIFKLCVDFWHAFAHKLYLHGDAQMRLTFSR